jgi:hypothetical protein
VRARSEQRLLGLQAPDRPEQRLAPDGIVQPRVRRIGQERADALDGDERLEREARRADLAGELVGPVEVGRRTRRASSSARRRSSASLRW